MPKQPNRIPTLTRWPFEIFHGLQETDQGFRWGWGFTCWVHDEPIALHGYPTDIAVIDALRDHLGVCRGQSI